MGCEILLTRLMDKYRCYNYLKSSSLWTKGGGFERSGEDGGFESSYLSPTLDGWGLKPNAWAFKLPFLPTYCQDSFPYSLTSPQPSLRKSPLPRPLRKRGSMIIPVILLFCSTCYFYTRSISFLAPSLGRGRWIPRFFYGEDGKGEYVKLIVHGFVVSLLFRHTHLALNLKFNPKLKLKKRNTKYEN